MKIITRKKLIKNWFEYSFIAIPHHLTLSLMRAIQWTPGRGCWASGGGWIGWQASSGWALIRYPASPESGMASPNLHYKPDILRHIEAGPELPGRQVFVYSDGFEVCNFLHHNIIEYCSEVDVNQKAHCQRQRIIHVWLPLPWLRITYQSLLSKEYHHFWKKKQ